MKNSIIVLGILLCSMITTYAQISQGGEPLFWGENISKSAQVPSEKLAKIDIARLLKEDAAEASKGVPFRFAYPFEVNYNPKNSGKWFIKENGDKFWIFIVESEGAKSLNFTFSDFYLPDGSKLFVYNQDRTDIRGAFTSVNNKQSRQLGIAPIMGDKVVIEYYQPKGVTEEPGLQMATIAHDYKGVYDIAKDFGDSGSCNNNVACDVGNNWRDQISSVALITLSNGSRFCTGALINNTANDGTPYFLTANHCTGSSTANWVFVFNYQSSGCGNSDGSVNQSISGSQLLKKGAATDYSLIRLSSVPPASYNIYYSGWDATGTTPANTTGIHHPSGDIKKISFDNDQPSLGNFNGGSAQTHWRVDDWDDGTTEPGSSGSPLFNQEKRIVGQLHGGSAACGNNGYDMYGRFDLSFPNLSEWLAPGSALRQIDGYDPSGGGNPPGPVAVTGVSVSPSTVTIDQGQTSSLTATITPSNASNTAVTWNSSNTSTVSVSSSGVVTGVAEGTAIITVTTDDGGFTDTVSVTINANTPPPGDGISLGNSTTSPGTRDTWNANLVINETDTYTNNSEASQQLRVDQFVFYARQKGSPVTPFVVRVNGDNDFTVLAVGTSRGSSAYNVGENTLAFNSGTAKTITVGVGETIATGFLDANANGSGGNVGSVIPFDSSGQTDQLWYTGGPAFGHSGSVAEGSAPTSGLNILTNLTRNYRYRIVLSLTGTTPQPPGGCTDTKLTLNFDNYPEETSWTIRDEAGSVVGSGGTYGNQPDGSILVVDLCLDQGCYELTVNDAYGDGLCCSYGIGSYSLTNASGTLASGASFSFSETKNFCIGTSADKEILVEEITNSSLYTKLSDRVKLYPNPSNSSLYINQSLKIRSSLDIEVIDITGRKVMTQKISKEGVSKTLMLNVEKIPEGSYFLKLVGDHFSITKRFTVFR